MFGGMGQVGLHSMMGINQVSQGMMGGLMSQGMATGAPILSGAAGLLGLDPLSLGLRAGQLAWTKGGMGLLGAGAIGMGTMAGVGVAGLGAAFLGGQMMSGAQQQMSLNRGLAQNFNFMNSQGGMGFTGQQGFTIGRDIRSMTHELGMGGEIASFSELSQLATNMGRMGMAQNVRTVKDFKEKFKQLVTSVKTIATELGTSLEEAQKMMASMRQVGIFKPGQAVAAAGMMRATGIAGGLAMSEISGMMNIGAQISRSVGGLGKAGAQGGALTIGQVGIAQKMGVLSEEDIYNATGLTGAEGRQAMAANLMSQSAQFLKGGRGRRFLASIAGAGGQLDDAAVAEWMTGGVGTGRTMELAGKNLSTIGRADFIRNEGRLRGAALEKFGGLAQTMVYKQWLQERGWDPNQMNDMSMLAFQRFSGMGRDEAESALKLVNKLPELMREQQVTQGGMAYHDLQTRRARTTGVEGMKRQLHATRERIQGRIQQFGADLLESGSAALAEQMGQIFQIYEQQSSQAVTDLIKDIRKGVVSQERYQRVMGGSKALGLMRSVGMQGSGGVGAGGMGPGRVKYSKSLRDQISAAERTQAGASELALMQGSNLADFRTEFLQGAGAGTTGEDRISGIQRWLKSRGAAGDQNAYQMYDMMIHSSPDQKAAMAARIEEAGGIPKELRAVVGLKEEQDRVRMGVGGFKSGDAATVRARQIKVGESLGIDKPWYAQALGGAVEYGGKAALYVGSVGSPLGWAVSGISAIAGSLWGDDGATSMWSNASRGIEAAADWVRDVTGGGKTQALYGMLLEDATVQDRIAGMVQGKGEGYATAQARMGELKRRAARHELGEGTTDAVELDLLNKAAGVGVLDRYMKSKGHTDVKSMSPTEKEAVRKAAAKATGNPDIKFDDIVRDYGGLATAMDASSDRASEQMRQEWQSQIDYERGRYEKMGVASYERAKELKLTATDSNAQKLRDQLQMEADRAGVSIQERAAEYFGGSDPAKMAAAGLVFAEQEVGDARLVLSADTRKALEKDVGAIGLEAAQLAMDISSTNLLSADNAATKGDELRKMHNKQRELFAKMSTKQKQAFARTMAGTEAGDLAMMAFGAEEELISAKKGMSMKGVKGDAASYGAIGSALGVQLSKEDLMVLGGKDPTAAASMMLSKMGIDPKVKTEKFEKGIAEAAKLFKEGKTGEAAMALGQARAAGGPEIAKALEEAQDKQAAKRGDPTSKIVIAIRQMSSEIVSAIGTISPGGVPAPAAAPGGGENQSGVNPGTPANVLAPLPQSKPDMP